MVREMSLKKTYRRGHSTNKSPYQMSREISGSRNGRFIGAVGRGRDGNDSSVPSSRVHRGVSIGQQEAPTDSSLCESKPVCVVLLVRTDRAHTVLRAVLVVVFLSGKDQHGQKAGLQIL